MHAFFFFFFLREQICLSFPEPPFHWEYEPYCIIHYLLAFSDAYLTLVFLPGYDAVLQMVTLE